MRDAEHDPFAEGIKNAFGGEQQRPADDDLDDGPRLRPNGKRRPPPSNDIVTEDSAALLFAEQFKGRLRFCHDTGLWFEHNGSVWEKDRTKRPITLGANLRDALRRTIPRARYLISKTSFATGLERFARVTRRWPLVLTPGTRTLGCWARPAERSTCGRGGCARRTPRTASRNQRRKRRPRRQTAPSG